MITVVKAKTQLRGGTVLSASDLMVDHAVAADVPEGVVTDPNDLVGKTLTAPVAKNQTMTPLTTTAARSAVPPGHVTAPLRLADAALAALLRPGDVVVAASARVVTVPAMSEDRTGPGPDGALVLIDVDGQTATVLAQAAASAALSIIWR
jgi:hypothetical protein